MKTNQKYECDCDILLEIQIGIDVVPDKQKHHVATDIVKIISNEVLKMGKIPYYGTA